MRDSVRQRIGRRRGIVDISSVQGIDGALLLRPTPHADERGFFCRTFDADIARASGIDPGAFVQDSLSRSARGVVRGLHLRRGRGEAKLVRCSYGAIFDVIVDLRPGSLTRGRFAAVELGAETRRALYVPEGFAHGFQTLRDGSEVFYQMSARFEPAAARGFRFDDPALRIPWPLPPGCVGARDLALPALDLGVDLV